MIVKGEDLLVLKGETPEEMMEWAAVIYYAVSLHNGGNPDIFELEARRLERIAQEAEKKRQLEEAVTLQALASEEERSRRLKEEAELQKQMLEAQERELKAKLEKEAEEKRLEAERLAQEEQKKREELELQKEEEARKEMEELKASLEKLKKEKEDTERAAEEALRRKAEQEELLKKQLEEAKTVVEAANKKLEEDEKALNSEESKTVEAAASSAKKSAKRRASVVTSQAQVLTETEENDLAEKAAELLIRESEGKAEVKEGSASIEPADDDSDDEVDVFTEEPKILPGATFQLSAPSGLVVGEKKMFAPKYVKDDKAWML